MKIWRVVDDHLTNTKTDQTRCTRAKKNYTKLDNQHPQYCLSYDILCINIKHVSFDNHNCGKRARVKFSFSKRRRSSLKSAVDCVRKLFKQLFSSRKFNARCWALAFMELFIKDVWLCFMFFFLRKTEGWLKNFIISTTEFFQLNPTRRSLWSSPSL